MKKLDHWENIILLLSAIALIPIWLAQSKDVPLPDVISDLLQSLQFVVLVVLVFILVRRLRRVVIALRKNQNRQSRFPF